MKAAAAKAKGGKAAKARSEELLRSHEERCKKHWRKQRRFLFSGTPPRGGGACREPNTLAVNSGHVHL